MMINFTIFLPHQVFHFILSFVHNKQITSNFEMAADLLYNSYSKHLNIYASNKQIFRGRRC